MDAEFGLGLNSRLKMYKYNLFVLRWKKYDMTPPEPAGTSVEEKIEIVYGDENIIADTLEIYSELKEYLDICNDSRGPSMFVIPNHPVTKAYRELKERGMRLRFIAEITKENIEESKELMKVCELRHLDEVKGNFGISDGIYYRASAKTRLSAPPPLLICSTLRAFVEQQQYFFDMLEESNSCQTEN